MNHILSLEMGASDYILKTTPPAVLLARLRLHIRQHNSDVQQPALGMLKPPTAYRLPPTALRFGTLCIDP